MQREEMRRSQLAKVTDFQSSNRLYQPNVGCNRSQLLWGHCIWWQMVSGTIKVTLLFAALSIEEIRRSRLAKIAFFHDLFPSKWAEIYDTCITNVWFWKISMWGTWGVIYLNCSRNTEETGRSRLAVSRKFTLTGAKAPLKIYFLLFKQCNLICYG